MAGQRREMVDGRTVTTVPLAPHRAFRMTDRGDRCDSELLAQ